MNKDFVHVPSKNVYLNINHIVELIVINNTEFKITLSNTLDNLDNQPRYWVFPMDDLKHFEPITGALVPIKE